MINTILNNIPVLVGACDFFDSTSANNAFTKIIGLAKLAVRIIQIVVPIVLIILGSVDIAKAVIAGKEDETQKSWKKFTKRLMSAVIVFLIPFIVGVILTLFNADKWKACWNSAVITVNQFINM